MNHGWKKERGDKTQNRIEKRREGVALSVRLGVRGKIRREGKVETHRGWGEHSRPKGVTESSTNRRRVSSRRVSKRNEGGR